MMGWSFTVPLQNGRLRKNDVEQEAVRVAEFSGIDRKKEVLQAIANGKQYQPKRVFSVKVRFNLSQEKRYLFDSSGKRVIPRADWGWDLDNAIKPVLNGLGPIIGYRRDWKNQKPGSSRDSSVVKLIVEKKPTRTPETVEITVEEVSPTQL